MSSAVGRAENGFMYGVGSEIMHGVLLPFMGCFVLENAVETMFSSMFPYIIQYITDFSEWKRDLIVRQFR